MKTPEKEVISKNCLFCEQWTECKKYITVEGLTVLIELECLGCGKIFKVVSI